MKDLKDWKDLKPKMKRGKETNKSGNFSNLIEEEE